MSTDRQINTQTDTTENNMTLGPRCMDSKYQYEKYSPAP